MASQVLRVGYRPLRVGLLIRAGNIDDLLLGVCLNTVLWGGVYNPLIPVGEDSKIVQRMIKAFKVDVLHPLADSDQLNEVLRGHKHLEWPNAISGASGLFGRGESELELHAVDVLHWVSRSRPEEGKSPYCIVRWNEADSLALLFACMFGQFPKRELGLQFDYQGTFVRVLAAQDVPILQDQSRSSLPLSSNYTA